MGSVVFSFRCHSYPIAETTTSCRPTALMVLMLTVIIIQFNSYLLKCKLNSRKASYKIQGGSNMTGTICV